MRIHSRLHLSENFHNIIGDLDERDYERFAPFRIREDYFKKIYNEAQDVGLIISHDEDYKFDSDWVYLYGFFARDTLYIGYRKDFVFFNLSEYKEADMIEELDRFIEELSEKIVTLNNFPNFQVEIQKDDFLPYLTGQEVAPWQVDNYTTIYGSIDDFITGNASSKKSKETKTVTKTETINKTTEKENGDIMMGIKGFDFGKVSGDAVKISHLGMAIKNSNGTFVSYDKVNKDIVDCDILSMDLDGLVYKIPVAIADIASGDVIIHNGNYVIVEDAGKELKVIDVSQGERKEVLPTKSIFGFDFVTKIVSMVDFGNLGASSDSPFGNMLPLMMMNSIGDKSGDSKGFKDMLPLLIMGGMGGSGTSAMGGMFSNPMMMMALMGDDGGSMKDMLPLLMMSGMGGTSLFQAPQKKECSCGGNCSKDKVETDTVD